MRILLSIALLSFSFLGIAQQNIQGFWHDSPHIGSGFGEYYAFYSNMNFIYSTNSMDCDQRLESYSGMYSIEGDSISLYIKEFEIIIGGAIEEDVTSCYNGFYINNGEHISIEAKKDYKKKYKIEFSIYNEEDIALPLVIIDGKTFYRLSSDPSNYIDE